MIPNDTFIIGSLFYSLWLLALYNTTYMPKTTYCQRRVTKLWRIGFVTIYDNGKTETYKKQMQTYYHHCFSTAHPMIMKLVISMPIPTFPWKICYSQAQTP